MRASGKNQWVPRPRPKKLIRITVNKPSVGTPKPYKLKKPKRKKAARVAPLAKTVTRAPAVAEIATLQFDGVFLEDRFTHRYSHKVRGLHITTLRSSNTPLLTIVTRRHPRRLGANYLHHVSSIVHQSSDLMEVVEIVGCTSVAGANRSLADVAALRNAVGKFVLVVDDDDYLMRPSVVQELQQFLEQADPDWAMIPVQMPTALMPSPWGSEWRPVRGTVGSPCMIVKRQVWNRHCSAWSCDKAADWNFALRLWDAGLRPVWFSSKPIVVVPQANEGRQEAGLTPPNVITAIAYDVNKDLGRAYNQIMARAPEDAWVCFLDHDAYFASRSWISLVEKAIASYPNAGMFTVITNRIANGQQILKGVDRNNHEFDYHLRLGRERAAVGAALKDVTNGNLISGIVMCISKRAWRTVGGFASGFLGVDNRMHQQLAKHGFRVLLISGVYAYHWYRGEGDTAHLKGVKRVIV